MDEWLRRGISRRAIGEAMGAHSVRATSSREADLIAPVTDRAGIRHSKRSEELSS
jgi:hypothetical protein